MAKRSKGFEPYVAATDQLAYPPISSEPGTFLFFYPALEEAPYSRHRPDLQHLAFMVESRAAVHAVHAKAQVLSSEVTHPTGCSRSISPTITLHSGWIQKASCWRRSACDRGRVRRAWHAEDRLSEQWDQVMEDVFATPTLFELVLSRFGQA